MNYTFTEAKVNNGNKIKYKVLNGTAYHEETSNEIVLILERMLEEGKRLRLFYGDAKTGEAWPEEFDVVGKLGRTGGAIKIPILLRTRISTAGGGILDHCIVGIKVIGKGFIYKHPKFNAGKFEILECCKELDFSHAVMRNNQLHAKFKSYIQALKYVQFMTGERDTKS